MTAVSEEDLQAGIKNLLLGCGGCAPGHSLLIVRESGGGDYYDPELAPAVARIGEALGLRVSYADAPFTPDPREPEPALAASLAAADCTVFLARLGDQLRFRPDPGAARRIVCYALDRPMMASRFGHSDYRAFVALAALIDDAMVQAGEIRVTCPAGTDFEGRLQGAPGNDTTCRRFPRSVFSPVAADGFQGQIAQRGFLTGTGSRYYAPYTCEIGGTLMVEIDGTRIAGFDGAPADVAAARAHYEATATRFGIDPYHAHSWHAGIHPGCRYDGPASDSFERWSGSAFGNPRLLHMHTCGAYPPGEISLNVLDPTVKLDGIALWDQGVLRPERLEGGAALLAEHPALAALFAEPETAVGQGASGELSFR